MSTRSLIAMQNEDGSVTGIYCHWDGYISHNGSLLNDYYQDKCKVTSLIHLGAISSLNQDVGPDKLVQQYGFLADSPKFGEKTLEDQIKLTHRMTGTVAYHRDRNEPLEIMEFDDFEEFQDYFENYNCGEEYAYLYRKQDDGSYRWFVETMYDGDDDYVDGNVDSIIELGLERYRLYPLDGLLARVAMA